MLPAALYGQHRIPLERNHERGVLQSARRAFQCHGAVLQVREDVSFERSTLTKGDGDPRRDVAYSQGNVEEVRIGRPAFPQAPFLDPWL